LEWYGLQLHHLSPHSITLVMIYVGMQPLVCLFRLFCVLRSFRKRASPINGYYFEHKTKGLALYIASLTP
jgi:hypothetical protein